MWPTFAPGRTFQGDHNRSALHVLTRFDNAISVVDVRGKSEIAHVRMFNPEPASITRGRRFLYDATLTSSHGDSACASCHIFGGHDSLAWDLGDPNGSPLPIPESLFSVPFLPFFPETPNHPMKGPMTTQSLRGMANHGPMHWRGDRNGGLDAPSAQPNSGIFDEDAAFKKFNVAFPGWCSTPTWRPSSGSRSRSRRIARPPCLRASRSSRRAPRLASAISSSAVSRRTPSSASSTTSPRSASCRTAREILA
jgi:hypothetical protein